MAFLILVDPVKEIFNCAGHIAEVLRGTDHDGVAVPYVLCRSMGSTLLNRIQGAAIATT
jgi:hypothetical protein